MFNFKDQGHTEKAVNHCILQTVGRRELILLVYLHIHMHISRAYFTCTAHTINFPAILFCTFQGFKISLLLKLAFLSFYSDVIILRKYIQEYMLIFTFYNNREIR